MNKGALKYTLCVVVGVPGSQAFMSDTIKQETLLYHAQPNTTVETGGES